MIPSASGVLRPPTDIRASCRDESAGPLLFVKYGLHLLAQSSARARWEAPSSSDAAWLTRSGVMSLLPNASARTTPQCWSYPRARPELAGCGLARRPPACRARSGDCRRFFQAPDRGGANPERGCRIDAGRRPVCKALPATPAFCWAHGRRAFFELADIAQNARRGRSATAISPVALEAVRRIDQLFEIERDIYGLSAEERLQIRRERSVPLLTDLESWLRAESARLSRSYQRD